MYESDKAEVVSIEDKLFEALDLQHNSLDDALNALTSLFVFCMSVTCEDCRKRLAQELRAKIPLMLEEATSIAAAQAAHGLASNLHLH
jgi:hypothetical protein